MPTLKNEQNYKECNTRIRNLLKNAEKNYYKELFEQHKSNMKKFWQLTKKLLNGYKLKPCQSIFKHNDLNINDGNEIVECFNKYFINVGPSTAAKIPPSPISPLSYLKGNYPNSFYAVPVADDEMKKLFDNLNNSAFGWDEFDSRVIKSTYSEILLPFMHICNTSLMTGVFPKQMKIS